MSIISYHLLVRAHPSGWFSVALHPCALSSSNKHTRVAARKYSSSSSMLTDRRAACQSPSMPDFRLVFTLFLSSSAPLTLLNINVLNTDIQEIYIPRTRIPSAIALSRLRSATSRTPNELSPVQRQTQHTSNVRVSCFESNLRRV